MEENYSRRDTTLLGAVGFEEGGEELRKLETKFFMRKKMPTTKKNQRTGIVLLTCLNARI
jgi:hypothetical protein